MKKLLFLLVFTAHFCSAQITDLKNKVASVEQYVTDLAFPNTPRLKIIGIKTVAHHKENLNLFVVALYRNTQLAKLYFVDLSDSDFSQIVAIKMTEDKLQPFINDNNFVKL